MAATGDEFQTLMKRVREGAPDAVSEFLETYGEHILRVVRRRLNKKLRSKYDSRDFTQEIWTDFFAGEILDRPFDSAEDLLTFLAAAAQNKVADAYRRRMRCQRFNIQNERSLDGSAAAEGLAVAAVDPTGSQVAMANEKFDELTKQSSGAGRHILGMLRDGLTHAEIARRLNVNEKTVRRVVARLDLDGQ